MNFRFKKRKHSTSSNFRNEEIELSENSRFSYLENYAFFCCDQCNFKSKNGRDFESHIRQHDSTPELDIIEAEIQFLKASQIKKKYYF